MILTLNNCHKSLFSFKHILRHFSHQMRRLSVISTTDEETSLGDREFKEVTIDSFCELIRGSEDNAKTMRAIEQIIAEYEYEKYVTLEVPSGLTTDHMRDLLALKTATERRDWFRHLLQREVSRDLRLRRRAINSDEYWTKKRELYAQLKSAPTGLWDSDGQLVYGLWHNSLLSKIEPKSVKRLYSHRLRRAAMFGQKLVVDMGFDADMSLKECRSVANQIQRLYNCNKYESTDPFDIHFTNCDPNEPTMQSMPKYMPNYNSPYFVSTFHRNSYLDLFDSKRLVYLSPHSRQPLTRYNVNDIYIIGAVEGSNDVTNCKAKREGIRTARLAIDEHIVWKTGKKVFSLDVMIRILRDLNDGHEMSDCLKNNIPKNRQKSAEDIELEDKIRRQKYTRVKSLMSNIDSN